MLSIGNISGGKSGYYLGQSVSKGSYYLQEGAQSRWGGGAMSALGIKPGSVDAATFDRLYDGYVGDERLCKPGEDCDKAHDPGRDLTFSAPKSVSILAQGEFRDVILQAHDGAVDKAMDTLEKHFAKTRVNGKEVGDQKIIYGVFREETSRAQDMDLHSQCTLFNIALGDDGKFRSLHNPQIYENSILLGQTYRAELKRELKALGFTMENAGKHGLWEIKEVPKDIRDTFSKRRADIKARITPENDTPKGRERLTIITRPAKKILTRETLTAMWNKQLVGKGTSLSALSRTGRGQSQSHRAEPSSWNADKAIAKSMDIRSETERVTGYYSLMREAMTRTNCDHTFDELETAISRQIERDDMARSDNGAYLISATTQRREDMAVSELKAGHLKSLPLVSERALNTSLDKSDLTDQQKAQCDLIARDHSRYSNIDGMAGVGKTRALKLVVPLIREAGYKVIGIAPLGGATDELSKTGVFDKTMTVQQYDLTPEGDKKTVLIVDETSMLGTNTMLSLTRFANCKEMPRVVFMGDSGQLAGVEAGRPFDLLNKAGVRTVRLDEIKRQVNERHREGLTQAHNGDIRKAFKTLRPEIKEVSRDNLTHQAVKDWQTTQNPHTPIIVQTNRQKNEINAAIKADQLNQRPDASHMTLKTWQPVYASKAEKRFVSTYEGTTHIRFNNHYKRERIKRGEIYKVTGINKERAELTLSRNGKTRTFRPARFNVANDSIELYRQSERTFHEGDRIRFTRADKKAGISNNDYGTVACVKNNRITFELDKGRSLTLGLKDTGIRHVDQAWASTAHAFQGKTVDHAILVMPSKRSPLTTLESFYTGGTRHRHSLSIVTDNSDRLCRSIEHNLNLSEIKASISFPEKEAAAAKLTEQRKIDEMARKQERERAGWNPEFSGQDKNNNPGTRQEKSEDKNILDRSRGLDKNHERDLTRERLPRQQQRDYGRGDFGR